MKKHSLKIWSIALAFLALISLNQAEAKSWTESYKVGNLMYWRSAGGAIDDGGEGGIKDINLTTNTNFSAKNLTQNKILANEDVLYQGDVLEFRYEINGDWFGTGYVFDSPAPYFLKAENYSSDKLYSSDYCNSSSLIKSNNVQIGLVFSTWSFYVPMLIKNPVMSLESVNLNCGNFSVPLNGEKNPLVITRICTVDIKNASQNIIKQFSQATDYAQSACKTTNVFYPSPDFKCPNALNCKQGSIKGYEITYTVSFLNNIKNKLNIQNTGTGTGTVFSDIQPGIAFPGVPSFNFLAGTTVKLTAQEDATTSEFNGWGGACAGTVGNVCTVTMDAAKTATVNFQLKPTPPPSCSCSGTDKCGNPVPSSTCDSQFCGQDNQFYRCTTSGYQATGIGCTQTCDTPCMDSYSCTKVDPDCSNKCGTITGTVVCIKTDSCTGNTFNVSTALCGSTCVAPTISCPCPTTWKEVQP